VEGVDAADADETVAGGDGQHFPVGAKGELAAAHAMLAEHGHQALRLPRVDFDGRDGPVRKGVEETPLERHLDGRAELERFEVLGIVVVGTGRALGRVPACVR
jgi:hypothetical protein